MVLRWVITATLLWSLVGFQAIFAAHGHMATPEQMTSHGVKQGVTFTSHGSTWWVVGALVPLTATLVALYAPQWRLDQWFYALVGATVISGVMHFTYTLAPYADYMVKDKAELTAAGYVHFVLFTGVIAVLLLTYTSTSGARPLILIGTACYITWHVFVGNHMLIKMNPPAHFPPYPFWDVGPIATIIAVAIIMAGASWWALR
jgi:hypothetical protein